MRRLWLTLALCVTLPTLMCKADEQAINEIPNKLIPQNLLKQNELQIAQSTPANEVRFGPSSLKFNRGAAQEVKIDHSALSADGGLFALEKSAEAAILPSDLTIPQLERLCNAVNEANEMADLRTVLSPGYYQFLDNRVKAGSSQYMVLAMLQAIRPQHIQIMDFNINEERGAVSVKGRSYFGPVSGLLRVVKDDGLWKIEKEDWYAGGQETRDYIASVLNPVSIKNKYAPVKPAGLMAQLSPDSRVNHNRLALSRAPYHKNGRSINFVFMLKKAKTESDRSPHIYDRGNSAQVKARPAPMHVMWTGSKRLMPEQKVVDVDSPVDFSIANFDDGYAPGQWNFIIPTKKPRELTVSFLLNF